MTNIFEKIKIGQVITVSNDYFSSGSSSIHTIDTVGNEIDIELDNGFSISINPDEWNIVSKKFSIEPDWDGFVEDNGNEIISFSNSSGFGFEIEIEL